MDDELVKKLKNDPSFEQFQEFIASKIYELELERAGLVRRTYPTSWSNPGKTFAPDAFED